MSVEELARKIKGQGHAFWGECCDSLYLNRSNHIGNALRDDNEKIIFTRPGITSFDWSPPGKNSSSRNTPCTIAVTEGLFPERRLLIAPDDSWPTARCEVDACKLELHFVFSMNTTYVLPVLGLPLTDMRIHFYESNHGTGSISLQWCDFNQLLERSDGKPKCSSS